MATGYICSNSNRAEPPLFSFLSLLCRFSIIVHSILKNLQYRDDPTPSLTDAEHPDLLLTTLTDLHIA